MTKKTPTSNVINVPAAKQTTKSPSGATSKVLPFATENDTPGQLVIQSYAPVLGDKIFEWIAEYYTKLPVEMLKSNSD